MTRTDGKATSTRPSTRCSPAARRAASLLPAGDIQRRCVLAMVNEAARCLEERIVRQPRDGDVGAVFGIGFPPFRGGPYRYMDSTGAAEIVRQLEALEAAHAGRFTPSVLLAGMAKDGSRFYPVNGKPVG